MSPVIAVMLQAASVIAVDFDIRTLPASKACGAGKNGEIVVCGSSDPDRNRIKQLDGARFEPKPFLAETGIAKGVTGAVVVDSAPLLQGAVSKRAMVRLTTKF